MVSIRTFFLQAFLFLPVRLPHLSTLSLLAAVLALAACGHTPVSRTVADAMGWGPGVDAIVLNPQLRYLRVSASGKPVLMVLGYEQATPSGLLETWYSNSGEVLQLRDGRLQSTAGLPLDWRAVRYKGLPDWAQLPGLGSARFERERDEMPAYRFGLSETVLIKAVAAPRNARLTGLPADALAWYEETVQDRPYALASARYGVRRQDGQVVYGEQCLSPDFCIAWQTWPPRP